MAEINLLLPHWPDEIAARAMAARADNRLSDGDMVRLDRWRRRLTEGGAAGPDINDCLAMGGLSTLERLRDALRIVAPEEVAPFRLALQLRRREKRARKPPRRSGRPRGRAPKNTASITALPAVLQKGLAEMGAAAERRAMGYAPTDARTPPTRKQARFVTGVLRRFAHQCIKAGTPVAIDRAGVTAWIDAAEERGRKAAGIAAELKGLRRALLWIAPRSRFAETLRRLISDYTRRARLQRKRKATWLLENPTDLARIWDVAERVFETALMLPAGSHARHKLLLEAAALAFAICCPLRVGDLHRVVIGVHLVREPFGWTLSIRTEKTGADYERDELWPELTPFLDALLADDVAGGDVWRACDMRTGSRLFSHDGGASGLGETWISAAWRRHVGAGAHIVRTLWHELVREGACDETWVALALCGQRNLRTADAYRVDARTERLRRAGRARLRARRAGARSAAGSTGLAAP